MQQGGPGPGGVNPGMMMQQNMMNVGGPQQMANMPQQQMQMGNGGGIHRGNPGMLQQQPGMMGPGGQMQHGQPSGSDGGMSQQQQAQIQARIQQMEQQHNMHSGQSPHHHPQQQQQQMGPAPGHHNPQQQMHHSGGGMGHEQQKFDNISKAKQLLPNLRESLQNVMKTASQSVYVNNMVDSGSKPVDLDPIRLDRSMEEFYSVCDQMEMHLRTSIECIAQGMSSQRYLPTPVTQTKMDGSVNYHQYISTVKGQISFAKEVHDVLAEAAQKMVD